MIHPVYILVYLIIFTLTIVELNNDRKSSKVVYYFVCSILIFLGGFRYYQGADYPVYVSLFYGVQKYVPWDNVFDADIEMTYVVLSKLIGEVFKAPFYWVTFCYALFSISIKSNFFYSYSPYPFLSLLLYYMPVIFFEDYGQIRQGASIAVCAFAFRYIVNRSLIKFLLCIVFAYYIHKSAIFFLFAYWIAPLKITTSTALFLIVSSVFLWPFELYKFAGPIIEGVASDKITEAYTGYLNDTYYGEDLGFGYSDIIKFFWLVIIFAFDREMLKIGIKYLYPRNLTLFFFIIFYLCRGNSIFAVRLPGAYAFYLYLLIPTIVFYIEPRYRKIVSSYILIFSIAIFLRFQPNALSGGFGKFKNVIFMSNPEFENEVI